MAYRGEKHTLNYWRRDDLNSLKSVGEPGIYSYISDSHTIHVRKDLPVYNILSVSRILFDYDGIKINIQLISAYRCAQKVHILSR